MKSTTRSKLLMLLVVLTMAAMGCTNAGDTAATEGSDAADEGSAAANNKESAGAEPSGSANAEKITLEYWTSITAEQETYTEIVKSYTDVNPNVEVKVTYLPTSGIDEKINVALAANQMPDLYSDSSQRLFSLALKGVFQPLDEYITPEYNLEDINPRLLETSKINGEIVTLPYGQSVWNLMVNKELFKMAGVEDLLPDEETRAWSRDDFEKATKAISELGNGIYGFGLGGVMSNHDKYIDGFIYADGDEYTNADDTKFIYNSDRNVKTFQWLIDLTRSSAAVPGAAGLSDANLRDMFKQGKIGVMTTTGFDEIAALEQQIAEGKSDLKLDAMLAHYPTGDGSPSKLFIYSDVIAVKKQEDKKRMEEAAKFALWLTSGKIDALNEAHYVKGGILPPRTSQMKFVSHPERQRTMQMADYTLRNRFSVPTYQENRKLFFDQFQSALNGEITAKEALDNFVENATKLLEEYNAKNK